SQLAIGAELLRIPHGSNIASLQDATPSMHRLATNIVFLTELRQVHCINMVPYGAGWLPDIYRIMGEVSEKCWDQLRSSPR
ncbi:MAG TPA: hypothetical protein VIH22_03060, partial [Cyclobacteriaceae bacterium]